jgi:DnaJ-class molecular chaperone
LNGEVPNPGQEEEKKQATGRVVKDMKLYDELQITPDATQNQIKKAYYKRARDTHPDKHRDDPEADAKFQKVGYAYQILIDETSRKKNDTEGEEGLKDVKTMDSKATFEMIFGSEKFEPLVGEL